MENGSNKIETLYIPQFDMISIRFYAAEIWKYTENVEVI